MNKENATKVLAITGSPRKNGNTNYVVNQLLERTSLKNSTLSLHHLNIEPCCDCRGCKKEPFDCIVQDSLQDVYTKFESADLLIFATPIYWFGPSAQMKLLIDRLRPYYGNKKLKGKKAIVIAVAGVGPKDCSLTEEMFNRIFNALEIEFVDMIKAKAFDIGDVEKDEDAIAQINKLANMLV